MNLKTAIPILRIFDIPKAREFYIDYLGFHTLFEHRFGENFPLYLAIRRGDVQLHLSEHHGDATPGSAVRIEVSDIEEFHRELANKKYRFSNPGLEVQPWGSREVSVIDPFGNRFVFFQDD